MIFDLFSLEAQESLTLTPITALTPQLPPPRPPAVAQTGAVVVPFDEVQRRAHEGLHRRVLPDAEAIDRFFRQPGRADGRPDRSASAEQRTRPQGERLRKRFRGRRGSDRPFRDPYEVLHSTPFLAQFVAQEVVPRSPRHEPYFADDSVAAYEATRARTAVFFGPDIPFELSA